MRSEDHLPPRSPGPDAAWTSDPWSGAARRRREFIVGADGEAAVTLRAIEWRSKDPRPILFLHGGGANAEWWSHVAPAFADLGAPIALDLRGHGDSDSTPGAPYGFSLFAGDVLAVLAALERPTALVGASMGGLVAMVVAARSADVERLVVVDSPLRASPGVSERRRRMGTPKRYASLAEAVDRFRVLPGGTLGDPALVRRIGERSYRELPDGTWELKYDPTVFTGSRRRGAERAAARIRVPLLFLRGAQSPLVGDADVEQLLAAVPGARATTLPGTSHHLFLDDPDAFVAAVRPFLAERT